MAKFYLRITTVDGKDHDGYTEGPDLKTAKRETSKDVYYDTGQGLVFRDKVINIDFFQLDDK